VPPIEYKVHSLHDLLENDLVKTAHVFQKNHRLSVLHSSDENRSFLLVSVQSQSQH